MEVAVNECFNRSAFSLVNDLCFFASKDSIGGVIRIFSIGIDTHSQSASPDGRAHWPDTVSTTRKHCFLFSFAETPTILVSFTGNARRGLVRSCKINFTVWKAALFPSRHSTAFSAPHKEKLFAIACGYRRMADDGERNTKDCTQPSGKNNVSPMIRALIIELTFFRYVSALPVSRWKYRTPGGSVRSAFHLCSLAKDTNSFSYIFRILSFFNSNTIIIIY